MWAVTGFIAGAVAGWLLGETTGGVSKVRVTGYFGALRRPRPAPEAGTTPRERIRLALEADPELGPLSLHLVPAGKSAVELHGWVPSRRHRARAMRLAVAAAGEARLIDCLLVRGEDDRPARDNGDGAATLQSA
jgi:hypothetical protein